jgi:uncharacterized membrane protein YjjB (DUF3815 family)
MSAALKLEPPIHEQALASAVLLRFAVALHGAGASADRVEAAMRMLADRWSVPGQFLVTPTSVMALIDGRSTFARVQPGEVSLGRRAWLEDLLASAGSAHAVDTALASPPALPWSSRATLLAEVLFGMCAAIFFGAALEGAALAGGVSLVVALVARLAARGGLDRAAAVLGAAAATAVAVLTARAVGVPAWPALLGGIISLAPGFMLTVAAAELAAGELVAGTARLAAAGLRFLQLGLAIIVVASMLGAWDTGELHAPRAVGGLLDWYASAASGLACAVLLQVFPRDLWRAVLGTVGGYALCLLFERLVGGLGGPLLAATALTLLARVSGRTRPAELVLVPGILTLVPGGAGIGSLSLMLQDASAGVAAAITTLLVAVALATGVLVGEGLARSPRAAGSVR